MLQLDKVTKFYSQNGIVTTGFSKVSLRFDVGEFVAITGESGSGKSTLLNVLSGLDSYEEGEMYILGQPTSGFGPSDMEEYRKHYIGSIFQTFNLINNYTVYQNVELVLLLSGYRRSEVKDRVNAIIDRVGLGKYRKTKTSKLSGGQKQRVAIARALAKETPIIVADEPTGNLDVESAEDIFRLLASLSKDKLVIIVTHNYEQVEPYVTRKITMHDGRVIEDKHFQPVPSASESVSVDGEVAEKGSAAEAPISQPAEEEVKEARAGGLSFANTVRLGIRNAFSLPAKLLLLLMVFLFLCLGAFFIFTSALARQDQKDNIWIFGIIFENADPARVVLKKTDGSAFLPDDYRTLESMANIKSVAENDLVLDARFQLSNRKKITEEKDDKVDYSPNDFYLSVLPDNVKYLSEDRVVEGRLPAAENELFLLIPQQEDGWLEEQAKRAMEAEEVYFSEQDSPLDHPFQVTGYGYFTKKEDENRRQGSYIDMKVYGYGDAFSSLNLDFYLSKTSTEALANKTRFSLGANTTMPLVASDQVPQGRVYVPERVQAMYPYSYATGKTLTITSSNLYLTQTTDLTIDAVYTKYNSSRLLNKKYEEMEQGLYVNPADYQSFYMADTHQASVFLADTRDAETTLSSLRDAGFSPLYLRDHPAYTNPLEIFINDLMYKISLLIELAVMFFIIYFVTRLIYKSQNIYFSTIRMLGAGKRTCGGLLTVDMLVVAHIAYLTVLILILKVKDGTIKITAGLQELVYYVGPREALALYGLTIVLTLLIALRYSLRLFKSTALSTYKEEV